MTSPAVLEHQLRPGPSSTYPLALRQVVWFHLAPESHQTARAARSLQIHCVLHRIAIYMINGDERK